MTSWHGRRCQQLLWGSIRGPLIYQISGNICYLSADTFNFCLQYINYQCNNIMASQHVFITIESNYFSCTQSCLISVNFFISISVQNNLSFLYTHMKQFCLLLYHDHYSICLPIKSLGLWNIYKRMVLKIVQLNLLLFPVVPITYFMFHIYLFYKKIHLLTKIIQLWEQWSCPF